MIKTKAIKLLIEKIFFLSLPEYPVFGTGYKYALFTFLRYLSPVPNTGYSGSFQIYFYQLANKDGNNQKLINKKNPQKMKIPLFRVILTKFRKKIKNFEKLKIPLFRVILSIFRSGK